MELKAVGKVGMVKRKQFLQKRDISRSHEVKQTCFLFCIHIYIYTRYLLRRTFLTNRNKKNGCLVLFDFNLFSSRL